MLIVVCRHCCAEVQLNFSEFTAERLCLGGTLDSIDIPQFGLLNAHLICDVHMTTN